jgi:antitoxin CcdA
MRMLEDIMKKGFNAASRKRPVNLTLNEDLVSQAKALTDNLSGVVETLLAEFVDCENKERMARTKVVEAVAAAWNRFNSNSGSIADEYSSL